jgi:CheY-like chemotaxis protein/two-component sensor histidine kinase
MLREQLCEESERDEGLAIIEKSAEAQKQLLDDLLDTARIAAGKVRLERSDIDLLSVVRPAIDSIMPMAKEKRVDIKTSLAENIGTIYADADRLGQVVNNLLTNAVKFTPSGGRVEVGLSKRDTAVELVVSDTGQGIEPEFLPRIFAPFSQADGSASRSQSGLGLGLAIAKELVELHGGTIHAESEGAGKGARFVVRLPLFASPQSAQAKLQSPPSETPSNNLIDGTQVLLVEDETQTREALVKLLGKARAAVTAVATAAEGFKSFKESQPDLIISDIGLPEENGYALMQRVRSFEMERSLPATPAIALTAFASAKDRHHARESGFHKHIAKPVTPAALLAAISTLLAEKEKADNGG